MSAASTNADALYESPPPKLVTVGAPGTRRLDSLQALRALAATSVIFMHIPFARWGGFGADVFFVLSGFVMCYISSIDDQNFLLKRIFRIVPLYWFGTIAVFSLAVLAPSLLKSTSPNLWHLLKSLFFIPYAREDHRVMPVLFLGWTLEYEVFFYFIFATALGISRFAARRAKNMHLLAILIAVSLLSLIVILGRLLQPVSTILHFYTHPVILEFAFGAVAFLLWSRYKDALERTPMAVPLMLSVLAYTFLVMFDLRMLNPHGAYLREIPGFVLRGFPGFVLCMSFLSVESRFPFPKLWLLIGDASYSLYLFHPYLMELVDKRIVSLRYMTPVTVGVSLLAIGVCCGFAILVFKSVELPVNRFLRRKFLPSKRGLAMVEPRPSAPDFGGQLGEMDSVPTPSPMIGSPLDSLPSEP